MYEGRENAALLQSTPMIQCSCYTNNTCMNSNSWRKLHDNQSWSTRGLNWNIWDWTPFEIGILGFQDSPYTPLLVYLAVSMLTVTTMHAQHHQTGVQCSVFYVAVSMLTVTLRHAQHHQTWIQWLVVYVTVSMLTVTIRHAQHHHNFYVTMSMFLYYDSEHTFHVTVSMLCVTITHAPCWV